MARKQKMKNNNGYYKKFETAIKGITTRRLKDLKEAKERIVKEPKEMHLQTIAIANLEGEILRIKTELQEREKRKQVTL